MQALTNETLYMGFRDIILLYEMKWYWIVFKEFKQTEQGCIMKLELASLNTCTAYSRETTQTP